MGEVVFGRVGARVDPERLVGAERSGGQIAWLVGGDEVILVAVGLTSGNVFEDVSETHGVDGLHVENKFRNWLG